jgi:hypothetical protein
MKKDFFSTSSIFFPSFSHKDTGRNINRCPLCVYLLVCTLLYERLTVPEENSNDDRHIKKERTNHIVNFFFLFSLSFSPFLLFRVIQKRKNEAKRRKKQSIAQHHYRRHRHTRSSHHLASRSDHLPHIYRLRLLRCHHNFIYYFE